MRNPISISIPIFILILILLTVIILPSRADGQPKCRSYTFNKQKSTINEFERCVDLPVLSSFLHWNYLPSTATLEIAYRHTGILTATNWVVWALNPTGKAMAGSQCLVAYHKPDGSMAAYTAPVDSYGTDLAQGPLSFNVSGLSAVSEKDEMIIFAMIKLPKNATVLNQVWQDGPMSKKGTPLIHSTTGPNVRSMASLDLLSSSGVSTVAATQGPSQRVIHGVLCALSWGIMMPIGALVARYMRRFPSADPAWFYLHVGCQMSAYVMGVAGWGLGLKLGNESAGVHYPTHRNIGTTLFVLGTLQVLALLMRPHKEHKYRWYWNKYHQLVGFIVIVLSVANIYLGIKILNLDKIWTNTYYGVVLAFIILDIGLEMFTWHVTLRKRPGHGQDGINLVQSLNYHRP